MGSLYQDYGGGLNVDEHGTDPVLQSHSTWDNSTSKGYLEEDRKSISPKEESQLKKENNLLRLKTEILIDMLAQKSAEVDALLRDNENLRAFIQDNIKQPGSRENEI